MKLQSKLLRIADLVNKCLLGFETFILSVFSIALVAAIFIEVICRYFLFISVAWAEELTRYLFIWLTFIGTAYAVFDDSHTEIDVFKQVLMKGKEPRRSRNLRGLEVVSIIASFAFLAFFGHLFFNYMMKIWNTTQTSPTMGIPMGLVYLPVYVGVVMSALHEIYRLIKWFSQGKEASAPETAEQ